MIIDKDKTKTVIVRGD
jgi:hypothetical protein